MDVTSVHSGSGPGVDNAMPAGLDPKQIFFTNLQLLGFDAAAMEIKYRIPFNKDMFNLPNKAGAEAVLYFLFNRLNPTMCRQEFRDCWPVIDKKSEAAFRKMCCIWLQNIQKEEAEAKLPRINASLFLSPGGDKFYHLLFAFSTYVVLHVIRKEHGVKEYGMLGYPTLTSQNKELGHIMETTVNCAAIRHRRRFMETVGQTSLVKKNWQTYSDELTRSLRGLIKDMRELDREKREQVERAAQKGVARGSPVPPSRSSHDFDMSAHTAKRAQRVQQVRGLWKSVEGFMEKSKEQQEIVTSIVDRTQEKFSIDAANIKINIPHLMLHECEQEMRRRQVDNIYEGGELNLVSVLQLWNLALHMYIQRLQKDELKDLSDEASNMRSQAHIHQAYLANTTALREKIASEVPLRKKAVAKLRSQFHSEVTTSGLGMTAPTPPVTFEPPRGHSGATPTSSILHRSPDQVETPEAATYIAELISRSSRKPLVEPFQTRAFGISRSLNQNNSNRLPQPSGTSKVGGSRASRQMSQSSAGGKGRGDVHPRVVRHISRQSTAPASSALKKPQYSKRERTHALPSQPLASTPEKTPCSQDVDPDRTPVPSDYNNPRQRAQNILAEKIVQAVMHGEDERVDNTHLPYELGLTSPHVGAPTSTSSVVTKDTTFPMYTTTHPLHKESTSQRTHTSLDKESSLSLHSQTVSPSHHKNNRKGSSHTPGSSSKQGKAVLNREQECKHFARSTSPVTLVQQTGLLGFDSADSDGESVGSVTGVHGMRRMEGDGGEPEAEDVNIENPVAALSEEAFVGHDLIERSPLAVDIRRMWQDAISDEAENKDMSSDKDVAADWLDFDKDSLISTTPDPGERLEENAPKTMISETLAFVTSFEEDPSPADFMSADDSTVEWEEHVSALYDDQEDVNNSRKRADSGGPSDTNAEDSQTPAPGHCKMVPSGHSVGQFSATPVAHIDSPLISFTPHTSKMQVSVSHATGWDSASTGQVDSSFRTGGTPQRVAREETTHDTSHALQSDDLDSHKTPLKLPHGDVKLSPENSSDKENCTASTLQDSFTQSMTIVKDSVLNSVRDTPKKVSFPPDSCSRGILGSTEMFQDEFAEEDDLFVTSGASPFNDSFTPLLSGLLVHGQSPARSTTVNPSGTLLPPQNSTASSTSSFAASASCENLDEKVAAQLIRLKKLKAEAFKDLEMSHSDAEGKRSKDAGDGIDSGTSLFSPETPRV